MNQPTKNYKDLDAWNIACDLAEQIYTLTKSYPKHEQYSLTNQMRRAAVSIPSNIAEGHGRWSKKEFAYYCRIALGSTTELETQIILSKRFRYATEEQCKNIEQLLNRMQRILNRLIRAL